jgi:phosphatidylserine/phosphatidylglycerophosphate/cardiolipin synthase-like enzyme
MAGAQPIVRLGRNAWRHARAEASGVLVDAADYYRAFYWGARQARHSILMSGWQFDSGVPVLRGHDVPPGAEVRFLKFLNGLCDRNPGLHIYLLAWDFHVVFAHEREWMQRILFHWLTNSRFRFRFDDCPAAGGSHHQKFVVIDGTQAFLGGMDVCEARWDDRRHLAHNPVRLSRGKPQKPYHDVQAYLAGPEVAGVLQSLFMDRWTRAGGPTVRLPAEDEVQWSSRPPAGAQSFGSAQVALSRTDPRSDEPTIREVERLFVDAIDAAEQLIYMETQYFSSRKVFTAQVERMAAPGRSRLEIVVVVNERAEALKEELAVGLRQAQILEGLRQVAAGRGHALGLYYSLCDGHHEDFRVTYIHSKVIVVDDRFATVGSANLTNRSMGIDSELHVSWESLTDSPDDRRLARAIRRLRVGLLAEHSGVAGPRAVRGLVPIKGLVARLDELTARPGGRLRPHGPPTPAQQTVMQIVDPDSLPFDPGFEEGADGDEPADDSRKGIRATRRGLAAALWRRFASAGQFRARAKHSSS